jgi:hypothetical protein
LSPPSYVPSENEPVERGTHEQRSKAEAVSVALVPESVGCVLDTFATSAPAGSRIEYLAAPTRYQVVARPSRSICDDDGEWVAFEGTLLVIEAKTRYTAWDEYGENGTVSERVLAQQTCELLGVMLQRHVLR